MKKNILQKIKNLITVDRALEFPQAIVAIAVICISVLAYIDKTRNAVWSLIKYIYKLEAWSTQANLKLWQVLLLLFLLAAFFSFLYMRKIKSIKKLIIERYISLDNINFEQIENYKFYWYKDINSPDVIIDKIPYCAIHNKKFVEVNYHNYICLEQFCNNCIVYVHINRLIESISDNIIEKSKKLK